jgi:hypothetical protein
VWPDSKFATIEHSIRIGKYINFRGNLLRLIWRTVYVVVVTVLAMAFPFFNDVLALLGAVGYVLANDSIFSCGDVHCSKEDSTGISQVVCSPAFELGVLTGCHSCGMWCH